MTDVRFAVRMLTRMPGTSALIVALLALGIGAGTMIFSLFDAVLLRALPVRNPEELVRMVQQYPKLGPRSSFPLAYLEALRSRATTLTAVLGETGEGRHFRMTAPGEAAQITVHAVTPEFFEVLGTRALHGRGLQADDNSRGFDKPPAVLSYGFWKRRFRGDARVISGQDLSINGHLFAVAGVMPREFHGLSSDTSPDVRISLNAYSLLVDTKLEPPFFELAGRLKKGASLSSAQAECLTIWRSAMGDYYRANERDAGSVKALLSRGMKLESLALGTSLLRDRLGNVLKLLMAAVILLMVIVCLNVAGLLLARAAGRRQETAVRLAIGASRLRIIRLLLTESLLLSLLGCLLGIALAAAGLPVALHLLPPIRDLSTALVPLSLDVGLNGGVLLFSLALAVLTTLIFAVGPALMTSRLSVDSVLRAARSKGVLRGHRLLIALQIALCTFMLAGGSLLVSTFQHLRDTDAGFARDSIATFSAELDGTADAAGYLSALTERVRSLPGVVSVATSAVGVLRDHGVSANVAPAGQAVSRADFMNANANRVSPEYFRTMGIKLLEGRDFVPSDAPSKERKTPIPTVINQAFARRFFPHISPLGRRFGTAVEGAIAAGTNVIIGVVTDAKYRSLREPMRPMFFTMGVDSDSFVLHVRSSNGSVSIVPAVQQTARSIAPGLPFLEVNTMAEALADSTAPERITALTASALAGIAALLAGAGTYGLLAYVVVQRRREIGIRMALGAEPRDVIYLIARQTMLLTAAGLAAGIAAVLWAGAMIQPFLYDVSPHSPQALMAAMLLVVTMAAAATFVPSRQATRVQPAETLRQEQ